ncbi:MAG: tetratricopeptide repeat protein [Chitinophagales bacterium]
MSKQSNQPTINILIDNRTPFFESHRILNEILTNKKLRLTQKETMFYKIQLALAELAIGNREDSKNTLAACEKYLLAHGEPIEKGTVYLLRSMHASLATKYEEALQVGLRALNMAQQLKINAFTSRSLINCGRICLRLLLHTEALEYFNQALELARQSGSKSQIIVSLYQQNEVKKEVVSAAEALKDAESLLHYKTHPKPEVEDISDVHIYEAAARAALACGEVAKTKKYFEAAAEIRNRLAPNSVMQIDNFLLLAKLAALENKEKEMLEHTARCLESDKNEHLTLSSMLAYEIRFDFFVEKGDQIKAKKNLEELKRCAKSIGSAMCLQKYDKCELKFFQLLGNREKELELVKKISAIEMKTQQQIIAYRMKHLNAIHELELLEKENQLIANDLNAKSQELIMANHYLQQRNELLSDLKSSIDLLKKENAQREKIFQTLFKKIDLAFTREESEKEIFKAKFDKTNAAFIEALSRDYPKITPTESRICALLRSGFNTKEIVSLLSTSERNVETHRLSIRKKLGLSRTANLNTVLASIKI